ncbi:hypothetical protein J2T13_000743 [Paenibacillus sp. DS2015]|uniref:hypothetical protein n=1 Tax=Paenibacillus sp. DS2015 TaxID=3373917 RepID=UPI003D21CD13
MDVQIWTDFLKQNWLVIIIALVILFVVLNLVKTMVKWALVIIVVAALLVYSGISLDQISTSVTTMKDATVDTVKKEAMNAMLKEAQDATYTTSSDGMFTVTTPNLLLEGQVGKEQVQVTFKGVNLGEWQVTDTIKTFITEAKKSNTVGK